MGFGGDWTVQFLCIRDSSETISAQVEVSQDSKCCCRGCFFSGNGQGMDEMSLAAYLLGESWCSNDVSPSRVLEVVGLVDLGFAPLASPDLF
jgi:hypothetical protein